MRYKRTVRASSLQTRTSVGSSGVGTGNAQAGIFANSGGEVGLKGKITIPVSSISATSKNVKTSIEVEQSYITDIYIKRD